jgi:hypothetical protein
MRIGLPQPIDQHSVDGLRLIYCRKVAAVFDDFQPRMMISSPRACRALPATLFALSLARRS